MPFAGSAAPAGYLLASGQAISRTNYAGLFAVINTTYGIGGYLARPLQCARSAWLRCCRQRQYGRDQRQSAEQRNVASTTLGAVGGSTMTATASSACFSGWLPLRRLLSGIGIARLRLTFAAASQAARCRRCSLQITVTLRHVSGRLPGQVAGCQRRQRRAVAACSPPSSSTK